MMNKETWILGIKMNDRVEKVAEVQSTLTKFGCSIKTRLGLHDINETGALTEGLIILELTGNPGEFFKLENELLEIEGVEVRKMIF